MRRRHHRLEIDGESLLRDLQLGDELTVVLRGHLHLEGLLNAMLELGLPAELFRLRGLNFPVRVELAVALGHLPIASRPTWLALNSLRNSFAHSFQARVSEHQVASLERILEARPPRKMGVFVRLRPTDSSPTSRLADGIAIIYADAMDALLRLQSGRHVELLHLYGVAPPVV